MEVNGRTLRREESLPIDPGTRRAVDSSNLKGGLKALEADVRRLASSGWPTTLSTALPSAPLNGQVIAFQSASMATLGIVWYLQYWSAASGPYKWLPVGSQTEIWTTTGASGSFSSTTPVLISGPSITLPLAGDYDVRIEARLYNTNGAGVATYATLFRSGGSTGINIDQYQGTAGSFTTLVAGAQSRTTRLLTSTSGSVIDLRLSVSASSGWSDFRALSATPVRVG